MIRIRKIVFWAVVLPVFLLTACGREKEPKVYTCSPEVEADLGTIKEAKGPVAFVLKIKNTTSERIVPYTTATRCVCLNAQVARTPVEAGGEVEVQAVYNPAGVSGRFMEEIQVFYGNGGPVAPPYRYLSVMVKGRVKPKPHSIEEDAPYAFGQGLRMSHEVLVFNPFREGERGRVQLRVASALRHRVRVTFEIPAGLDTVLTCRPVELAPGACDTVTFLLSRPNLPMKGLENGVEIYPYVNGKKCDKPLLFKHFNTNNR